MMWAPASASRRRGPARRGARGRQGLAGLLAAAGLWHAQGYQQALAPRERMHPLLLPPLRGSAGTRTARPQTGAARRRVCMGLEFPRREAQQSREYNVARVRGGYYLSDKEGNAPLEEVIASRVADVGQPGDADADDADDADDARAPGGAPVAGAGEGPADVVAASKYMPSLDPDDPILREIYRLDLAKRVTSFELLDSRWNGNEVLQYFTDQGSLFVKMNRVEDQSVFMAEAVGLTSILRTQTVAVPKPLHVGTLPKVGLFGPGAFLITEFLQLEPFGALKGANQKTLGEQLAQLHTSDALADVHKGRCGFVVNNLHSLSPQDNTWKESWPDFFYDRMLAQVKRAYKATPWGRAPLPADDLDFATLTQRVLSELPELMRGTERIAPALLHGDLWIGNTGATASGPVIFDPACFFGHSEYDLAIMRLFGGFSDEFFDAYHAVLPRAEGFERRQNIYCLYHYLNQLNLFGDPAVRDTCVQLMRDIAPLPEAGEEEGGGGEGEGGGVGGGGQVSAV